MNTITKTYSRVEEILNYLYDHTNVQHKTMVGELHISGSTLTDTLKVLESCNFVRRVGQGNIPFFFFFMMGENMSAIILLLQMMKVL